MDPLTILEDHFEASYVAFGSILELDATSHHSLSDQSGNNDFNSINLMPQLPNTPKNAGVFNRAFMTIMKR
ncbi:hypothetical protein O181_001766 [Austropuccinia psidii MF-1]|uniref:Uncharacterized protein n=1 Tax=Austropuccinia psidii MF-1 TaxID=1389203 RepID=A0A9Q3BBP1_9BASI|nr:hypothetical protein [Austropuccinia psidii MF-1]